uniref:Uncharacterized protein n=1 Tax=Arundo donax TaxID=35708 RepID=A0A0A9G9R7_ARUDO
MAGGGGGCRRGRGEAGAEAVGEEERGRRGEG